MLLPIGHEKNTVTRLPIVTAILILTNILAFAFTIRLVDDDSATRKLAEIRNHILVLEARYPDLAVNDEVRQMTDDYRKSRPEVWKWISDENRPPADTWEATLLADQNPNPQRLQEEMSELCREFTQLQNNDTSFLWLYAYHSYHPKYRSYISHQFLHGGILHLVGNMWMLYLCGVVLEDVWGPFIVLAFYLIAGICAATFHGLMTPNSIIPMLGASGSIAGLMGAMLARFPKLKIKMAFWFFFIRPHIFYAPVYVLAPAWFLLEILWGVVGDAGVAHWAHVGGFVFGLAVGFAFYFSKVENFINPVEPDTSWKADEQYLQAQFLLDKRETESAVVVIRKYLQKKPDVIQAWQLLFTAQNLKNDTAAQRDETLPALIRLTLTAKEDESAIEYVREFRKLGGKQLPPSTWLELGRCYERLERWDDAVREYEQVGQNFYASDPASLTALMSAARVLLTKLDRPVDAHRLYEAARNSPLPHLELEQLIQHGLKQSASAPGSAVRSANSNA